MVRFLSTILFLSAVCFASECQAQRPGGFLKRHFRAQQTAQIPQTSFQSHAQFAAAPASPFAAKPIEFSRYSTYRNPTISRILDGPTTKFRDPAEVDSRYIGGFHQSHFNNIGIPSGDIGIRGNAYQWRTW